jgi:2-methylisocitrate lyase-like PEP mutase family enzyme
LVSAVAAPVNITAHAGMPNIAALGLLGVAQITIASSAALAALAFTRRLAATLRASGGFDCLAAPLTHADAQRLFTTPKD